MTDNDNLELKKRSRRRLVGAAALALLAAIVLPMVMDQEPESPAQDIQITIPDREADSALARPIAGRPSSPQEVQVAPPPVEQPPGPQSEPPSSAAVAEPAPSAPPATQTPSASAPKPPESAKAPETQKPPAAEKPSAAPSADEAARVRALLEGRTTVAAAPGEAFVVQVGAFGDSAKAATVSSQLKGKGFAAYTEKAGTVTRVRIGPFANREEAGKVAERLRADGIQGVVTTR